MMDPQDRNLEDTIVDVVELTERAPEKRTRTTVEVGGMPVSSMSDLVRGAIKRVFKPTPPAAPTPPVAGIDDALAGIDASAIEPPAMPDSPAPVAAIPAPTPEADVIDLRWTHEPPAPPTAPAVPVTPEVLKAAAVRIMSRVAPLPKPPTAPKAPSVAGISPIKPPGPIKPVGALTGSRPSMSLSTPGSMTSGMKIHDLRNTGGTNPMGALVRSQKLSEEGAAPQGPVVSKFEEDGKLSYADHVDVVRHVPDTTKAAGVFSKDEDTPPSGPGILEMTMLAWAANDVYQMHQERTEWFERKAMEAASRGDQSAATRYRYGATQAHYDRDAAQQRFLGALAGKRAAPMLGLTHSYADRRDRDLELWRAWKAAPGPQTLGPLMKSLEPAIRSETNRWGGQVPDYALELEAKKLAVEALKTYDPKAGAALATHVLNRLQKLSRTVYKHQDAARLPENKKLQANALWKAQTELTDALGREPSVLELADHTGWSKGKVTKVLRAQIGEMVESKDLGGDLFSDVAGGIDVDPTLELAYHDMTPDEKLVFEHTTGWGGRKPLTARALAQRTGKTPNQVAYIRRRLTQKLQTQLDQGGIKSAQASEMEMPQPVAPVVFTDIDGVLAHHGWWENPQYSPDGTFPGALWDEFEYTDVLLPGAVQLLDALCTAYGAELVISSAWRQYADIERLVDALRQLGFTRPIIDRTPDGDKRQAVISWLFKDSSARSAPVRPFVVLDDDRNLAAGMEPSFVLVDSRNTLTQDNVREAAQKLDRQISLR